MDQNYSLKRLFTFLFLFIVFCITRGDENAGRRYAYHLRSRFEQQFNKTCSKYPFVQRYIHQLENPGDKYVVFVYHEQGLRNGGLGDRIGGLITATTIALRYNRTLLIESANDFGSLFRPYHPLDITKPQSEQHYTWNNWTQWTKYNISLSNNDNTELDLWDCINCVSWKNRACGMDDGDVGHPIVKLRANRAYLCKWMKHTELQAHKHVLSIGIGLETNLLEAAGCMMRLVMWPTEKLWASTAREMSNMEIFKNDNSGAEYGIQIGMHFRCGDLSYKRPGSFDNACRHDTTGNDPHAESDYMSYATPDQLGRCAKEVILNYTRAAGLGNLPFVNVAAAGTKNATRHRSRRLTSTNSSGNIIDTNSMLATPFHKRLPVVYIASDNPSSAAQMNETCGWPMTYISPKGCHVEMDKSADCNLATTTYWLILALSDIIVHQSDLVGSPISAFSRYAAVFGLHKDSYRDAKNCSRVVPFEEMSHKWMGNWFCD